MFHVAGERAVVIAQSKEQEFLVHWGWCRWRNWHLCLRVIAEHQRNMASLERSPWSFIRRENKHCLLISAVWDILILKCAANCYYGDMRVWGKNKIKWERAPSDGSGSISSSKQTVDPRRRICLSQLLKIVMAIYYISICEHIMDKNPSFKCTVTASVFKKNYNGIQFVSFENSLTKNLTFYYIKSF